MSRRTALVAALVLAVPATVFAKPPWISIEVPVNPWDQGTRGAFLVVHTYHFSNPASGSIQARAVGVVNGERRDLALTLERTAKAGEFVLRNQWGSAGRWVLVIEVAQGTPDNVAQALVQIGEDGQIGAVRVPTRVEGQGVLPRRVSQAEIEAALRAGE